MEMGLYLHLTTQSEPVDLFATLSSDSCPESITELFDI